MGSMEGEEMKDFIKKMLSDNDGNVSSMRVKMFLAFLIFFPTFVYIWSHISLKEEFMQDIPSGVIWLLGVLLGASIVQKGIEVTGQIFNKDKENK